MMDAQISKVVVQLKGDIPRKFDSTEDALWLLNLIADAKGVQVWGEDCEGHTVANYHYDPSIKTLMEL